jgi:hypothetical protein
MREQRLVVGILLVLGLTSSQRVMRAQESPAQGPMKQSKQSTIAAHPPSGKEAHRFWDGANQGLFAGVGAARALDFASTRHFRNRGVDEWLLTNSVVDNKPLFAGAEAAGTAASILVAYAFHRTGHHRLERWLSIAHIVVGTGEAIRNFTLNRSESIGPLR